MPSAVERDDPFTEFLQPPKHESSVERAARERKEAEAKEISDRIDEEIKQERAKLKRERDIVKILLLGQSESGKSTTLKNFRLTYSRSEWDAEKTSWRTVIQLNLIRSINTILDTLQAEIDGDPIMSIHSRHRDAPATTTAAARVRVTSASNSKDSGRVVLDDSDEAERRHPRSPRTPLSFDEDDIEFADDSNPHYDSNLTRGHQLQTQVSQLRIRLAPLKLVEMDLRRKLGAGTEEITEALLAKGVNGNGNGHIGTRRNGQRSIGDAIELNDMVRVYEGESKARRVRGDEVFVRGWRWREMMKTSGSNFDGFDALYNNSPSSHEDPTEVIWRCKGDMKLLWTDEQIREVLEKRGVVLENNGGFFLDDIDRIATRSYEPSDDDVVRARLRTLGVQEHRVVFEALAPQKGMMSDPGREWIIYDVGGSRTVRRAWVPYFENITAIIFLAPISCFDERLLEDSNVNRLEDSVTIWRAICSTKLLSKTTMICFLNKCDILKRKLDSGIQFKTHVPMFGDRENSAGGVVKFLRSRFKDILNKHSPEKRAAYIYATTVTDTKTTAATLTNVRDSVLQEHLKRADIL